MRKLIALLFLGCLSAAQAQSLSDDFTRDTSLNAALWNANTPLLRSIAGAFSATLIQPRLGFSGSGMTMSGVSGLQQFAGIQSNSAFLPPFTIQTSVTGIVATGNPFFIELATGDHSSYMAVSGNVNPNNIGNYGMDLSGSGISSPPALYATPSINVLYTFSITVSASGTASIVLTNSAGAILGSTMGIYIGTGPLYVILGQYEGQPAIPPGPNMAIWQNVSVNGVATTASPLTSILPQFAFGGGWYSALYFTNISGSPVSFTVNFVGDSGSPLSVPGLASSTVNLAGRGSAIIEAPNVGSLAEGYVTASLPSGVTGYGVFRQSAAGIPDQEAVVPLSGVTSATSTLLFDNTKYVTGVALVNLASVSVTVTAVAHDNQGNIIGTATIPLGANAKTEAALTSLIGGVSGVIGSVDFTSTGNLAALGLRFNGSAFTSIPTSQR